MRLLLMLIIFCLLTVSCSNTNKPDDTLSSQKHRNAVLINVTYDNLDFLASYKNQELYSRRRHLFNMLIKKENTLDKGYLKKYIQTLKRDVGETWPLHRTFEWHTTFLDSELLSKDIKEIYNDVLCIETAIYQYKVNEIVKMERHISAGVLSRVYINEQNLNFGQEVKLETSLLTKKNLTQSWKGEIGFYRVEKSDTILQERKTFVYDDYPHKDFTFKPNKKGNYVVRGFHTVFDGEKDVDLEFETIFTVR